MPKLLMPKVFLLPCTKVHHNNHELTMKYYDLKHLDCISIL